MKCTSIEVAHAQDYVPSGSHVLDPDGTVGQGPQNAGIPRYELGMQFDLGYWNSVDPGLAAGVRFHYNFNGHVALDSELTSRRQDLQVNGLLGLRAGQRVGNSGLFVLGRAGFLHYGGANGFSYLSQNTVPAFDVGLTMEHYSNPMVLRFELGELIVPYVNAIVLPPPRPRWCSPLGRPRASARGSLPRSAWALPSDFESRAGSFGQLAGATSSRGNGRPLRRASPT